MDVLSAYMVYTFWPSGVNLLSSLSQSLRLSRAILRYRGVGCILGQQYCHVGFFFLVYSCIMKDSNNCQNPKVQNTALQQDDQQYSHQLPVVLVMWFVSLTHITLRVTLYKFSNCLCENRDLCNFNFISSAFVAKLAQLTAGSG